MSGGPPFGDGIVPVICVTGTDGATFGRMLQRTVRSRATVRSGAGSRINRLCQPEIQDLYGTVLAHPDVGRLQIAVLTIPVAATGAASLHYVRHLRIA